MLVSFVVAVLERNSIKEERCILIPNFRCGPVVVSHHRCYGPVNGRSILAERVEWGGGGEAGVEFTMSQSWEADR